MKIPLLVAPRIVHFAKNAQGVIQQIDPKQNIIAAKIYDGQNMSYQIMGRDVNT